MPDGPDDGPERALPRLSIARLSTAGCAPFLALVDGVARRLQPLGRWRSPRGEALLGSESIDALLQHWPHNRHLLANAPGLAGGAPLTGWRWHAPVAPRAVYCTIGNYRGQLVEAALDAEPPGPESALQARRLAVLQALERRRSEGQPYAIAKPATTVAAPWGGLPVHTDEQSLDWEVEIGAVIGRTAWQVPAAQALDCIAGYCTVNDITLRQRLARPDLPAMGTDFLQAKGRPGWLPVGPVLVPASEVPDPQALRLQLRLNGQVMQDGGADDMVFDVAEQIAYLSRHVRLEPGDLVCTGSPAGFGQHHRRFLRPGDRLEAEVIGLGAQRIDLLCPAAP